MGALVRLGRCLDLLDPSNTALLRTARDDLDRVLAAARQKLPANANNHKYLDCAVFNWLYALLARDDRDAEEATKLLLKARGYKQNLASLFDTPYRT